MGALRAHAHVGSWPLPDLPPCPLLCRCWATSGRRRAVASTRVDRIDALPELVEGRQPMREEGTPINRALNAVGAVQQADAKRMLQAGNRPGHDRLRNGKLADGRAHARAAWWRTECACWSQSVRMANRLAGTDIQFRLDK